MASTDDNIGVNKTFVRNLSKIGGILIGVFLGWLFMVVFIILFALRKKKFFSGFLFWLLVLMYGAINFVIGFSLNLFF